MLLANMKASKFQNSSILIIFAEKGEIVEYVKT